MYSITYFYVHKIYLLESNSTLTNTHTIPTSPSGLSVGRRTPESSPLKGSLKIKIDRAYLCDSPPYNARASNRSGNLRIAARPPPVAGPTGTSAFGCKEWTREERRLRRGNMTSCQIFAVIP